MKRRELLKQSATLGFMTAMPFSFSVAPQAGAESFQSSSGVGKPAPVVNKLTPPADGTVPVAFLISDGAVVIDFCGPWEVFGNVMVGGRMDAFRLYTVSETTKPITASGGMKIIPDYTLESAPVPKVIVIPAQSNSSETVLEWIRKSSKSADLTMSVCTGAYLLAQTGLLAGKTATTHHGSYVDFAMKFPDIRVERGVSARGPTIDCRRPGRGAGVGCLDVPSCRRQQPGFCCGEPKSDLCPDSRAFSGSRVFSRRDFRRHPSAPWRGRCRGNAFLDVRSLSPSRAGVGLALRGGAVAPHSLGDAPKFAPA